MEWLTYIVAGSAIGLGLGVGIMWLLDRLRLRGIRRRADEILAQSRQQAEQILRDAEVRAREDWQRCRDDWERQLQESRAELRERERRLQQHQDALTKRQHLLKRKEQSLELTQKQLAERQEALAAREKELEALLAQQSLKLQEIAGLSREEASAMLLQRLEQELSAEINQRITRFEERFKNLAEERAREILSTAIQRYAAGHTAETTVSTVDLPSDEMKGRIIGREGRNIRTFEKITGVDVIIDDTPGVVVVSSFDAVRREVARQALKKLIADGRIHPARIEEVVRETQIEIERHIMEAGRAAVQEANIGHVSDKIVQLLGRLKFRTSYSQNVLQHSIEVALLCGLMAEELGLDGTLARRCGLLHDIGKAADHDMEGGHPEVGAELARRYGETRQEVLHAILCHHDDIKSGHIYTVLVAAADAISASRPGARRETLEKYVKRMQELEALALTFPGVEQAYAIQAGRELRVIAQANKTTDQDAIRLSRDIARAIEQQLEYPGDIKVTVIREIRAVDYAR
ncbi:MAG: ribonuclease Y [Gemmatales bacterium]|nr:ribonuclease Y [Gemmatales bacterium]MCS7160411.1 ribonuclease Y [Gemmatales bacterium]MDW8175611.1 ribonuclease Y [Gemmatales bacterium]MDW8222734.1 ribonuclease Y [Gemmatales bacterium]